MRSRQARAMKFAGLVAVSAVLVGPALAGVTVVNPDQAAYDALIDQPEFDPVGRLNAGGTLGSGVYLGDRWVLTAAHVAEVSLSFSFSIDGTAYASEEVFVFDDWDGTISAGNDIALIRLANDVVGVDPALLYEPQTGNAAELFGQTATYTGFGQTGVGSTGATGPSGAKVGGQNAIENVGGGSAVLNIYDPDIFFADFDDPLASDDGIPWSADQALALEYLIAPGDSGGGVFVESGGDTFLVGVNSFVFAFDGDANSDYQDLAGATYVPAYYDWLLGLTGLSLGVPPAPLAGDLDLDGDIDDADFGLAFAAFTGPGAGPSSNQAADLDGDGDVDDADFGLAFAAFTGPSAGVGVPEPGGVLLLGALAAGVVARRGRRCFEHR